MMSFGQVKRVQNIVKNELKKRGHGRLNPWPHHVKNHENKEVKINMVKGIRTVVLAEKCNLKEKNKKWEEWDLNPPPLNNI